MKTERRHELQTNTLADWTGQHIEQMRPHGKKVLGAAILGAAIIITAVVLVSDRQDAKQLAWNDFYLAFALRDREALAKVSQNHPGTKVALWAQKSQADLDLSSGLTALYTNRDEAYRLLGEARQSYGDVVDRAAGDDQLLVPALLGLAQVNEATNNLDKARDYYQKLVQQYAGTSEAEQAASRLEALKDPEEQQFYAWFDRQKPSLGSSSLPQLPGMPDDLSRLPDRPDIPIFTPLGKGAAGESTPAESLPGAPTSKSTTSGDPGAASSATTTDAPAVPQPSNPSPAPPALPSSAPSSSPASGGSPN
jgi:hypothetical protein